MSHRVRVKIYESLVSQTIPGDNFSVRKRLSVKDKIDVSERINVFAIFKNRKDERF